MASTNKISNVKPDFDDLVSALKEDLQQKDSWTDLLPYAGGTALIDFMSAIGTMLHYSIERSTQELNSDTAELTYSKYSNARSIGVNPNRAYPASVLASLTIDGTGSIPAYTQFQIEGLPFYNPSTIINPGGINTIANIMMFQGDILKKNFMGTGQNYQILVFGTGFTVGEQFVSVTVGGTLFKRQKQPLWDTSSVDVFQERTKPDGSVEIVFGNGVYGRVPALGEQIVITYAECAGASGNSAKSNVEISLLQDLAGINSITGVTNAGADGVPSNGRNQDSVEDVTFQSPRIFSAANRAVKRDDWRVLALTWPTIDLVDAFVWGEHEQRFIDSNSFGPMNMNIVHATALPLTGSLTTQQLDGLKTHLEQYSYVNSLIVMSPPEQVEIKIFVDVYVNTDSLINTLQSRISLAVQALFGRQTGSLGKTYYESDIIRKITSFEDVDYCKLSDIKLKRVGDTLFTSVPTSSIQLKSVEFMQVSAINVQIQTTER